MSQELNTTGKLIDQVVKPVMNGAIVYLGAKALGFDTTLSLPLVNKSMDAPMALGVAGVASSFGAELAHNFILPHINQHSKLGQMEAMLLAPAINGGLLAGIVYAGDPLAVYNFGMPKLIGLGAAAEVGNTYAFETFVRPFLHMRN